MKVRIGMMVTCALILVGGCVPDRYEWSPDGKWMTVVSDDGLRIADSDGNLLPIFIEKVGMARWFSDSKRVLAAREIDVPTWDQLAPYLTAEQEQSITAEAQRVREAVLAYDWSGPKVPQWDDFSKSYQQQEEAAGRDLTTFSDFGVAIAMYLRDGSDPVLRQKIPAARWAELSGLSQSVHAVEVYDIDATGATKESELMSSVFGPTDLRVSPTGKAATVVLGRNKTCELWVAEIDGNQAPKKVAEGVAWYPDWTADGKEVVFIHANDNVRDPNDGTWLGSVSRVQVVGDDGQLLKTPGATVDMAGLASGLYARVRCLKDGRIVFSAADMNLPAAPNDLTRTELFALEPGKQATVTRLLPRQTVEGMGDAGQYFEISPDGQHASIPDHTGKVSVVDLATGAVTWPQNRVFAANNGDLKLPSVPQWRSADELTFVVCGDDRKAHVMLWSLSKNSGTVLSDGWPDKILAGLVQQK